MALPAGAKPERQKSRVRCCPGSQEYESLCLFLLQDWSPHLAVYKGQGGSSFILEGVPHPADTEVLLVFSSRDSSLLILGFLSPLTCTTDSAVRGNVCISKEGTAGSLTRLRWCFSALVRVLRRLL